MYQLYDPETTYVFPNGKTADLSAVKIDFPLCDSVAFACVADDGVLSEMTRLSVLKGIYQVEDEDPQAAIDKINQAIAERNPNPATVADIQAQLDALAGA